MTGVSQTAKRATKTAEPWVRPGLFEPNGIVNAAAVAARYGVTAQDLAETLGLGRDALVRSARAASPKSQQRLGELIEILNFVRDWAGSDRAAMAWFRSEPIPAFGGRSPESLVKSGKAALVRDYLDHIALGGYA